MNLKSIALLSCFLISINLLFSQEPSTKFSQTFGSITLYEMNLKSFEKDKDAEALVIYDIGKSKFYYTDNGFIIHFERKTKIKIFTSSGIKWATIEIPFYGEGDIYEKVEKIVGFTYNIENGGISKVPLNNKTIYEEKINDAWKQKKFAFPNVKEGSVIEFTYTLETPYTFNLPDWEFQSSIPTLYSEYEVHMVPFYTYSYIFQGATKFSQQSSFEDTGLEQSVAGVKYHDMVHKYIMTDVPAFKDEGFITSVKDYILKIDFQKARFTDQYGISTEIISTWPKMCNDLLDYENFGKYIKNSSSKSESIFNYDQLISSKPEEKLKLIHFFVKTNFSWNGRNTKESTKSVKEFLKEKTGSSGDINLFLCGMLNKAGISATPVVLSTRDHGKIKFDYPFLQFFNNIVVLVKIDSTNLLVDATDWFCPYNLLPQNCINDRGLLVEKNSDNWVNLTQSAVSVVRRSFNIKIPVKSDSLEVLYKEINTNYDALELRKIYNNEYNNLEKYINEKGFSILDSIKVENYLNQEKAFNLTCLIKYETELINDKIYISPFMEEPISINPFKQSSRSYPIDMEYKRKRQFYSEIDIPEGYKIEHIPVNQQTLGKLVQYDYKISQPSPDKIIISGFYVFNEAVYKAEDYLKLKFYYNDIIKIFNEKIVLVKKETHE